MYREALQRLREGGWVFACDCSRSKIMREREEGYIRGDVQGEGAVVGYGGVQLAGEDGGVGAEWWR